MAHAAASQARSVAPSRSELHAVPHPRPETQCSKSQVHSGSRWQNNHNFGSSQVTFDAAEVRAVAAVMRTMLACCQSSTTSSANPVVTMLLKAGSVDTNARAETTNRATPSPSNVLA